MLEVCNFFLFILQKKDYSYEIGGLTATKLPGISEETLKFRLLNRIASVGLFGDELNVFCIIRGK